MELLTVKLIVLGLMGAVRIICGMLPLAIVKCIKRRWSKTADRRLKKCISILVFFGGGVMLATCFLHMMPEVQESFSSALPDIHLPIPQIIFVTGFFLVYMMEDIVHALIHKRKSQKRHKKNKAKHDAAMAVEGNRNVENGKGRKIIALPYSNNDSSSGISVIGRSKNGEFNLNSGLCYANNYSAANNNEGAIIPRETKELFDKNVVRKCDDIPGLPKNHSISTTNIQSKDQDKQRRGRLSNGVIVGVEKFSYIDPEWFRDTVIANSEANLHGGSRLTGIDNRGAEEGTTTLEENHHDLHLNKSQNINTISDDSNSSTTGSSGSTSCSRKKLQKSSQNKRSSSHAHHHHHHEEEDDEHEDDHFHHEHSHIPASFMDGEEELDQTIGAEIRNILIVIAISFHGIFEGLAIGLQGTAEDVWYMFFAVSLHECTILFCIGVEFISNKTKKFKMILYVVIVSLVSPIGIAVGILITERSFGVGGVTHTLVVGSLQGLAAGSLLYVTFFEIFQEEGRKLHRKYIHILVAILGFVMMGALEFLGGHKHGGSENGTSTHGHSHGNHHNHHDHGGHHNETDDDHHHHEHDHGHDDDHSHHH